MVGVYVAKELVGDVDVAAVLGAAFDSAVEFGTGQVRVELVLFLNGIKRGLLGAVAEVESDCPLGFAADEFEENALAK